MAISALEAARTICEIKHWKVTHLSLQKILYFAQMLFIGTHNEDGDVKSGEIKSLINEEFQAWKYGPVVASLYHDLKGCGNGNLTESVFQRLGVGSLEIEKYGDEYAVIEKACKMLENFDAGLLISLTHSGEGAWVKHFSFEDRDTIIPKEEIYYEFVRRTGNG